MLINLHSHLEGRVRVATALELARELGLPEPRGGWSEAIQLQGPADLTTYLHKVASTYPFFRSPEHITRIAREAVEDSAAEGQDYLELRFGPATHVSDLAGLDEVVSAVCRGVREGTAATGMAAGVVIAALRHHGAETSEAVARAAARAAGTGVVGFDLAGDELLYPRLEPYVPAFAIARAVGLGLTCHAAEAAPAPAVRRAVDLFGVTRVGHAAHLSADRDVMAWVVDRGVVVEICPTSNWYTGAIGAVARHPAPLFRGAGVQLVLGDDNPAQTLSTLSREREVLSSALGFSEADLSAVDETSVRAAFLTEAERTALRSRQRPIF